MKFSIARLQSWTLHTTATTANHSAFVPFLTSQLSVTESGYQPWRGSCSNNTGCWPSLMNCYTNNHQLVWWHFQNTSIQLFLAGYLIIIKWHCCYLWVWKFLSWSWRWLVLICMYVLYIYKLDLSDIEYAELCSGNSTDANVVTSLVTSIDRFL